MKSLTSIAIIVLAIVALVGGFLYTHSAFSATPGLVQTTPAVAVNVQSVNNSITSADSFAKTVTINGAVPLNVDNMARNPSPLFGASR